MQPVLRRPFRRERPRYARSSKGVHDGRRPHEGAPARAGVLRGSSLAIYMHDIMTEELHRLVKGSVLAELGKKAEIDPRG